DTHSPSDLALLQALTRAQVTHARREVERRRGQRDFALFKGDDLVEHLSVTPQAGRQDVAEHEGLACVGLGPSAARPSRSQPDAPARAGARLTGASRAELDERRSAPRTRPPWGV